MTSRCYEGNCKGSCEDSKEGIKNFQNMRAVIYEPSLMCQSKQKLNF